MAEGRRGSPVSIKSLLVLGAALATLSGCGNTWDDYRWVASSHASGLPQSGRLSDVGAYGLLLHTELERNPWVLLDLLKSRQISHIVIENRLDCCQRRGLPLVVELDDADVGYVEVARRTTPFDTWEIRFPPARARYVRIRSEARTILHLGSVKLP